MIGLQVTWAGLQATGGNVAMQLNVNYNTAVAIKEFLTRYPIAEKVTTASAAVGATALAVDDTSIFSATGGKALAGVNEITYTGRSAASGAGNLTGIPAENIGSILVAIAQGATVRVDPLWGAPGFETATGAALKTFRTAFDDLAYQKAAAFDSSQPVKAIYGLGV